MKTKSYKRIRLIRMTAGLCRPDGLALIMLFPFIYMITTSLKEPKDTFNYPPRLLPREDVTTQVAGQPDPLPLYYVTVDGQDKQYALVESNIRIGIYAEPNAPDQTYERPSKEVNPTGGLQ